MSEDAKEVKPAETETKADAATAEKPVAKATAVADKPEVPEKAPAPEEKPVNTDVFMSCTSRCSRRAWNIFLNYQEAALFTTRQVRGRLTFKTPKAAQEAHKVLVEQGGVVEITTRDNWIEFTGTLCAVQLVLKQPDTTFFDALLIE